MSLSSVSLIANALRLQTGGSSTSSFDVEPHATASLSAHAQGLNLSNGITPTILILPKPNRFVTRRGRLLGLMKTSSIESQIAGFLGKYGPEIEGQLREARTRLRAMFPRGFELVFDNYNALVFAISPTERRSDAFLSVVGYPKWVTLFFLYGTDLHDPNKLLEGQGKRVRSIRLRIPADINTPPVEALIAQAAASHAAMFLVAPPLTAVIKLALARQRLRRPAQKK